MSDGSAWRSRLVGKRGAVLVLAAPGLCPARRIGTGAFAATSRIEDGAGCSPARDPGDAPASRFLMRVVAALIAGALVSILGTPGGVSPARAGLAPNDRVVVDGGGHNAGRLLEIRKRLAMPEAAGRRAHRRPDLLVRLGEVRERLARYEARHRAIGRRAGELDRESEELDRREKRVAGTLSQRRQQIETLERELDRTVPRLLARLRELRESREITAKAVAGLAALSRNVELDGTSKARLLAISPVILGRLRTTEARADAMRKEAEAITAEHRQARSRASAMAEELEHVRRERGEKQQARARALARLPEIRAGLVALRTEQQVLARRVLAVEDARAARAGPQADAPALDEASLEISRRAGRAGDAVVKALISGQERLARGVDGVQPAAAHLVAMIPHQVLDLTRVQLASRAAPVSLPPPVRPVHAALRGDLEPALPDVTRWAARRVEPMDASALPALPLSGRMAHVAPSRLDPAPIVLIPGRVLARLGEAAGDLDGPGVTISTARGQPVAAPEDGRIVFAGAFRSYGLLLIIAHEREYHTLLWGFSELEVQIGDRVRTGQVVGVMSRQGTLSPRLHVELRRNGRPVDPLPWLAANTSKVRG
jgi:septal ring factor EnvC (AmiA/AmiB activator)